MPEMKNIENQKWDITLHECRVNHYFMKNMFLFCEKHGRSWLF